MLFKRDEVLCAQFSMDDSLYSTEMLVLQELITETVSGRKDTVSEESQLHT